MKEAANLASRKNKNQKAAESMLKVADQFRIRQAYYNEKKSIRAIARETGYSRNTVKKAIEQEEAFQYKRRRAAPAPVLGPYKERLKEYYYDPSKFDTYLEQLGIDYPQLTDPDAE